MGRCVATDMLTASPASGRKTASRPTISSSIDTVISSSSRSTFSACVGEKGSRKPAPSSTWILKLVSTGSDADRPTAGRPASPSVAPRTPPWYTSCSASPARSRTWV